MKSTATRYGHVAVTIHWLSAVLIVALLVTGFRAGMTTDSAAKAALLKAHLPLGIAILVLTVARLAWWAFADRKPDPVAGSPAWQEVSGKVVHVLFYIVIIAMAGSGIAMMAMSEASESVMGGSGNLPDFWDYAPRLPHGLGARLMMALLVLHIGAALYHHFVQKDGLIARMWFGRD